jgi:hypothetical protein
MLTIVGFVHNWDVVLLRIGLSLLFISGCYSSDNNFRMGTCWLNQSRQADETTLDFYQELLRVYVGTHAIFAAPRIPNRSAPSFFATFGRFAKYSAHSPRLFMKSYGDSISLIMPVFVYHEIVDGT